MPHPESVKARAWILAALVAPASAQPGKVIVETHARTLERVGTAPLPATALGPAVLAAAKSGSPAVAVAAASGAQAVAEAQGQARDASPALEELFDAGPIKGASLAERAVSKALVAFVSVLADPLTVPTSKARAWRDRRLARRALAGPTTRTEPPLERDSGVVPKPGAVMDASALRVGKYGTSLAGASRPASAQTLKTHFRRVLEPDLARTASDVVDAFSDDKGRGDWIAGLATQARARMRDEGAEGVRETAVRELYLDKILVERAARHGLEARKDGLPFDLVTFDPWAFFHLLLRRGRVFVDWTGVDLKANSGGAHHARGHLLQMTYAAERVPGFARLIKHIGRTGDRHGLWSMLFDNNNSTASPFWGGRWIEAYGPTLGIRN